MGKKDDTRTYILTLKGGNTRRITVPASYKITFGNVLPYQGKDQRNSVESRIALRFYEGSKENLRAVMLDVVDFRDASLPVIEKRTSVKREVAQKQTKHGSKDVILEARVTEWVNPDDEADGSAENNEFLQLQHKPDDEATI